MKAKKNTLELKKLTSAIKVSRLAYAGMFAGLLSPLAHAGPEGGVVTGGSGTIDINGTTTTIDQNTDLLSIDWDSFNLSAEELVKFLQPNTSSVVLNRILDQSASTIHGSIEANGHVILVNPRGVLFTESATINVGAITASGLDMSPEDFMNGDFTFKGEEGSAGFVVNRGVINAASAVLVGKQVTNASSGLISAELVSLAAADEAILTFDADGMIGLQVTKEVMENDLGVDSAVLNEGNIDGAQVLLEASVSGDLFTAAVNNEGTIKAQGIDTSGGKIRLFGSGSSVINSGELQAAGTTGGQVVLEGDSAEHSGKIDVRGTAGRGGQAMVLGEEVLVSGAIDARGTVAGGEILIGGDYQGKNSKIRNAKKTTLTEDAHIDVSGIGEGDGGEVIVWADHTTEFAGTILAESGEQGGDGGFVETSGKVYLNLGEDSMYVSTLSYGQGVTGEWLLDPNWLDIVDNDSCTTNCMHVGTLVTALSSTNITLQTGGIDGSNGTGSISGDISDWDSSFSGNSNDFSKGIRIKADLEWSSATTLTLDSHKGVMIHKDASVNANGLGSLVIEAKGDVTNKGIITGLAKFSVKTDGNFTNYADSNNSFSGSIRADSVKVDAGGNIENQTSGSQTASIISKKIDLSAGGSFVNDGNIKLEYDDGSTGVISFDSFSLKVGQAGSGSDNTLGDIQYAGTAPLDEVTFTISGSAGTDKFTLPATNYDIALKGSESFSLGTNGLGDKLSFTFNEVEVVDVGSNSSLTGQTAIADSFTVEANSNVVVDGITFTGIDRITDEGSATDPEDSLTSENNTDSWTLTAIDNQVIHNGITITGIENLSGGKSTLNGYVNNGGDDAADAYKLDSSGNITVDRMIFAGLDRVIAAGNTDRVEATEVASSRADLLGDKSFELHDESSGFTFITFTGIEQVVGTGTITGTSGSDSFTVADESGTTKVRSQNIDFYGVSKVDGGDDSDTLVGLTDT
ncbi:filamentous hemagglutinin N-terminal domain-containing protein, partial [uncultured Microbulbifer sp.]|uniref:two-partner secretion domain-containing protein n=1 Tax=uncultured Microbulbifer sp. TaxID=348147 RepID=UPI00262D2438